MDQKPTFPNPSMLSVDYVHDEEMAMYSGERLGIMA